MYHSCSIKNQFYNQLLTTIQPKIKFFFSCTPLILDLKVSSTCRIGKADFKMIGNVEIRVGRVEERRVTIDHVKQR